MNTDKDVTASQQTESQPLWETDLKTIEIKSEQNAQTHAKFVEFLKSQDSDQLDQLVQSLSKNVAPNIDCMKCANCCKSLTVGTNFMDITNLAVEKEMEIAEFKAKFLKKDHSGNWVMASRPCPFLKDNKCSSYQSRPSTCRSYPHLEKEGFIGRLGNVMSNLKVCPIAYNTFELLKLHFE